MVPADLPRSRQAAIGPGRGAGRDRGGRQPPGLLGQYLPDGSADRRRRRPARHILKGRSGMAMLHHTGLTISDLDRSLRFWRDAMGMEVLFQQEKKGGYLETIVGEPGAHVRMAHLAFDGEGTRIELFEYVSPAGGRHVQRPADVGFAHVCVACDDTEERLERLLLAGGAALSGPGTVGTRAHTRGRRRDLRGPGGPCGGLFGTAAPWT